MSRCSRAEWLHCKRGERPRCCARCIVAVEPGDVAFVLVASAVAWPISCAVGNAGDTVADSIADVIVIGAGIAGASAAFELAKSCAVVLLEREPQPGYHSTGRSAALYTETYGNPTIRTLTGASGPLLRRPPAELGGQSFLSPRGTAWIARADQLRLMESAYVIARTQAVVERLSTSEACTHCPILRPDYVAAALLEPGAMDIDVNALHQAYLRALTRRGGRLLSGCEVLSMTRTARGWRVKCADVTLDATIVVNAAGAWADEIARASGIARIGLVPARRTALTFDAPGFDTTTWPCVIDVAEEFYFKPDAGRLLGSPADEQPHPPADVQPEDLDVAMAVDRIERATTLNIARVHSSWAGLRCFVVDRSPVIGEEPQARGFFWLAAQGGSGVMTAPAAARTLAELVNTGRLPDDVAERGVSQESLAPARLRHPH
jgi:D-arginine dehydrogenase